MVVIRLRRGGRTHDPHYRLVVQEKRSKLNGSYVENLGHYHPTDPKKALEVNKERLEYWLSQGAELSPSVTNILVRGGFLPPERRIVRLGVTNKPVKAEETTKEEKPVKDAVSEDAATEEVAAKETAPDETPAETPADESPAEPETAEAA